MKRFVQSEDRSQSTLLPESLDEYIDDDSPDASEGSDGDESSRSGLQLQTIDEDSGASASY